MVRIRTQYYKSENLTFKYDVNVDKEGNFTTTIPPEVAEKLIQVGINLRSNKLRNSGFFSAKSLEELQQAVKETANQYSEKELIEEKIVILYSLDTTCGYCKGKSGKIYPDGSWARSGEGDDEEAFNWGGGTIETHATERKPFGFKVAFEIKKAKTWKFPNGEVKKEYLRLFDEDSEKDDVLHWLDCIRGMGFSSDSSDAKEMDYSNEAGLFFKNLLLYIFNLNEKLKLIFGDEINLDKIDLNKLKSIGFSGEDKADGNSRNNN